MILLYLIKSKNFILFILKYKVYLAVMVLLVIRDQKVILDFAVVLMDQKVIKETSV